MNDSISRQAAIDALDKRFDDIPMEQTTEILLLRKDLRELPSAEPERKKGVWIMRKADSGFHTDCICSECKSKHAIGWDFCPNCGAEMISGITAPCAAVTMGAIRFEKVEVQSRHGRGTR